MRGGPSGRLTRKGADVDPVFLAQIDPASVSPARKGVGVHAVVDKVRGQAPQCRGRPGLCGHEAPVLNLDEGGLLLGLVKVVSGDRARRAASLDGDPQAAQRRPQFLVGRSVVGPHEGKAEVSLTDRDAEALVLLQARQEVRWLDAQVLPTRHGHQDGQFAETPHHLRLTLPDGVCVPAGTEMRHVPGAPVTDVGQAGRPTLLHPGKGRPASLEVGGRHFVGQHEEAVDLDIVDGTCTSEQDGCRLGQRGGSGLGRAEPHSVPHRRRILPRDQFLGVLICRGLDPPRRRHGLGGLDDLVVAADQLRRDEGRGELDHLAGGPLTLCHRPQQEEGGLLDRRGERDREHVAEQRVVAARDQGGSQSPDGLAVAVAEHRHDEVAPRQDLRVRHRQVIEHPEPQLPVDRPGGDVQRRERQLDGDPSPEPALLDRRRHDLPHRVVLEGLGRDAGLEMLLEPLGQQLRVRPHLTGVAGGGVSRQHMGGEPRPCPQVSRVVRKVEPEPDHQRDDHRPQ